MTWLELARFVNKTVAHLPRGAAISQGGGVLIVENPDGEGGAYDVYTTPTIQDAFAYASAINHARESVTDAEDISFFATAAKL